MRTELPVTTTDGETLEAERDGPDHADTVIVLTHPHPAYGGSMHVPVIEQLFGDLAAAAHGVVRFNFRGAGRSTGAHDGGDAERLDVAAATATARTCWPDANLALVGYSFGADMILASAIDDVSSIALVAPPLRFGDGSPPSCSTLLLVPEHDQFSPPARASAETADWPNARVEVLPGTDHFLAGALSTISDAVVAHIADAPADR